MLILAVETSTWAGSVALVEAPARRPGFRSREKILGEATLTTPETHSARLMPAIDGLLRETSRTIHQVQGIALGLGPGSFTGLRIGVATVKGLAYSLGIPVAGVPTLEALAHNVPHACTHVCPVLDARKKEIYAALFRGNGDGRLARQSEDWVLSPEDLCLRISEKTLFLGNGLETYGEIFREKLGTRALFAPPELCAPRAAVVARLAANDFEEGRTLDLFSFTPLYVRRSEAQIHYSEADRG
jgi:tRNA threonylcarbamoyladenosine biosynthesis protein TsaB